MKKITKLKKAEVKKKTNLVSNKTAKKFNISSASMAYYAKTGELERIGHGLYKFKGSSVVSDVRWEDLVEAAVKVKGGIICLISALALYGLTEEIPREHWIAISNATRHRGDDSIRIVRFRNIKLGKTTYKIDGIELPIFDRERTIIDSFRFLGSEVAIKALKLALTKKGEEKINLEKLRKYGKALRVKIEPYILAVNI